MSHLEDVNVISNIHNALWEAAVDAIIVIDAKGKINSLSNSTEALFGYSRKELLGQNVSVLMPQPHQERHDSYIQNYIETGERKVIGKGRKVYARHKDGSLFPMHLSIGRADIDGSPLFIGICHDLTDYIEMQRKADLIEQRYSIILDDERELICHINDNFEVTFVNQALLKLFSMPLQAALGKMFCELFFKAEDIFPVLKKLLLNKDRLSEEGKYISEGFFDGRRRFIEWRFRILLGEKSLNKEIQAVGLDVTEREEAGYQNRHDLLTKLLNRRALTDDFEVWRKENKEYAVIYVDFNHLQIISHLVDFDAPDKILFEAANRIRSYVGSRGLIARVNSSDFLMVIEIASVNDAELEAYGLIERLESAYKLNDEYVRSTVSCGISLYPSGGKDINVLIEQAEAAIVYCGGSASQVTFFDSAVHESVMQRALIEQRLRGAIEEDELEVYLQPKVNLLSQEIVGYEALLRWRDITGELIPPSEFIPVAEQAGMGEELDRYVLAKVVKLVSLYIQNGKSIEPIAINITAQHFHNIRLLHYVSSLISSNQICPGYIELEITEGAILGNSQVTLDILNNLRGMGIKISIDDFGTGYSSLSYLSNLSIDALKIDKAFVDKINEESGLQIVKAIVSIAESIGVDVIAEGIENEEQLITLLEIGCQVGQGYYFEKPKPYLDVLGSL